MGYRNVKHRSRRYLRADSSIESAQDDTNYYRCLNCGFVCNAEVVDQAKPRPNASKELTGVVLVADGDIYAPSAKRGCPKCGTLYSRER